MSGDWRTRARGLRDPFERKMFVAGILEAGLRARGERPVVVGGLAVEWHSRGLYQSADIDLLCPSGPLDEVLTAMGFTKEGRHWFDAELGVAIEAPGRALEAYRDRTIQVQTPGGTVTLVSVEESILDRLRACVHWNSALDGEQALHMMVVQRDTIDWAYLEGRSARDQVTEKWAELRKRAEAVAE